MGESHRQPTSRLGLKSTGGEIIEVQGGHIVRATGRKDRHSKVCTAKGPRDRRVRLSANTAIQFYDVQDRLGYDRPSKAVDWLIKKAKSAIDDLAQLPPWHPTATAIVNTVETEQQGQGEEENQHRFKHHRQLMNETDNTVVGSNKRPMEAEPEASGYVFQHHQQQLNNSNSNNNNNNNNAANSSSFHPLSLDSDAFADTMKSFFPMVAPTSSSSIHFQNYPPDLLSRTSSQTQDLRLSLQSFQDPILLHHHHHHHHNSHQHSNTSNTPTPSAEQALLAFDSNSGSWSEQQQQQLEMGRFQRMVAWNAGTDAASGGFLFHSPSPALQPLFGQNPLFSSQRGPLQSSNSPSVRAWTDPPIAATTYHHHQTPAVHPSSISGIGFASGGFSGFHIPARIQGEEEQDDDVSNKPSSASSASRH